MRFAAMDRYVVVLVLTVILCASTVLAQPNDREVLRDRIDWLLSTHEATVDGAPIAAVALIDELYHRRDYKPAWSDPQNNPIAW